MKICVFGAASNEIDSEYINAVEKLGEMMSKRGHELVFGAGKHGLMGAAARGVKKNNSKIYGVIPSFFKEERIEAIYTECDELIFTETMAQRKSKMEDMADAFIIVPGGMGTYEEFFEVLTLKQLGRHEKPIGIYNIKRYYDNLEHLLQTAYDERFIRNDCKSLYFCSENAEEVLEYIETDKPKGFSVHDLKNG